MKNDSVYPIIKSGNDTIIKQEGLTKREYFAGLAMQGILAKRFDEEGEYPEYISNTVKDAVEYADALLKELEK